MKKQRMSRKEKECLNPNFCFFDNSTSNPDDFLLED